MQLTNIRTIAVAVLMAVSATTMAQEKISPIRAIKSHSTLAGAQHNQVLSQVNRSTFSSLLGGNMQKKATPRRTTTADGAEVLIDEDFSGLTKGTIDEQDPADFLSGYYVADEQGNYGTYWVYEGLMKQEGWSSLACLQAGGAVGLSYPNYGGCLNTPIGDYSGELTITFRVHVPKAKQNGKNHFMYINVLKGTIDYPESAMEYSKSVNQLKITDADLDSEGWYYDTIRVNNTYGGMDSFIQFNAQYDQLVLDDVKITSKATFLATPSDIAFSDYKKDGFTAYWNKIAKATSYTLDVYSNIEEGEGKSFNHDFTTLTANADSIITGGMPEDIRATLGPDGGAEVGKGEANATYSLLFNSEQDTIVINGNGGQFKNLTFDYLLRKGNVQSSKGITVEFFNGNTWTEVVYIHPAYTDWHTLSLTEEVANNAPVYKVRLRSMNDSYTDELLIGSFDYECGAPVTRKMEFEDLAVSDTTYTFTGLNPEAFYFVRVSSHNSDKDIHSEPSDYNMAFGISSPVALPATDVDERGGYTANWEATPKASYYEVDNFTIKQMKEDQPNYIILSEGFDGATETAELVNMTTTSLDAYTTNSTGWLGYLNLTDKSAVGGDNIYGSYLGIVATPEICLNNDGGKCTVNVRACAESNGDYLIVMNKAGQWNYMPLTTNYSEAAIVLEGCVEMDQLQFMTYNGTKFLVDSVCVTQNLKADDQILEKMGAEIVEGKDNTSMRFSQLDTDYATKYAYEVYAYCEYAGKVTYSEKSNRIIVNLDGEEDGIEEMKSEEVKAFADGQNAEESPLYNLAGQRVGKNFHGVVIVNGKKVIK